MCTQTWYKHGKKRDSENGVENAKIFFTNDVKKKKNNEILLN